MNPRAFVLDFLAKFDRKPGHVNQTLPSALKNSNLDQRDRALVTELVYGILRSRLSLDWLIGEFSSKGISKMDSRVLNLLRLGIYQLVFLDKIPSHAAVDTTVELAKKDFRPGVVGFVNAVLRETGRKIDNLPWPDRVKEETLFLSVFYSHPLWLVKLWLKEVGKQKTEALLAANNTRPSVALRVNTLKTSRKELIEYLEKLGVEAKAGEWCPEAIHIQALVPQEIIDKGLAYVQNEGSMLISHMLALSPGQSVIDYCAAPGGKTTHMAQLMMNDGEIFAIDVSDRRLALVDQNRRRLGIKIIRLVKGDASLPIPLPKVDDVLVDAPCSGLGVLARRPDSRWQKRREDIERLANLQGLIVNEAANHVNVGGFLTYSVCTITRLETTEVVDKFLKGRPDFSQVKIDIPHGRAVDNPELSLRLWPDTDKTDGMFVARFIRNAI